MYVLQLRFRGREMTIVDLSEDGPGFGVNEDGNLNLLIVVVNWIDMTMRRVDCGRVQDGVSNDTSIPLSIRDRAVHENNE